MSQREHPTQPCWHYDLGLAVPRTMTHKFLLFITYPICGVLFQPSKWTKINDSKTFGLRNWKEEVAII